MFADVIVDISNSEVDKVFEYSFLDCPVKLGSRVMVPFGKKVIEGIVISTKERSEYPPEKIKPILSILEDIPALTEETLKLAFFISEKYFVSRAMALRLFLPVEMRKGKVREQFLKYIKLKDSVNVDEVLNTLPKTAKKQRDLLLFLSEQQFVDTVSANKDFGVSAVKGLIEKEVVYEYSEKKFRSPYKGLPETDNKKVVLTDSQKGAIEGFLSTDKETTLLFGVTGSGKTEVYLELIDREIKKGRTAIMLVPEISLTPQMLRQLRSRFGDTAAILHSGLSAGERFDEWWRLRTGEAKIAIGARSAVFAPLENLGIIIIDEEHDGSYTSESSPRYSTIDVAKYRVKYNGAKLLLGSATPSIESFLNAKSGIYNLVEMPLRINKKPLPDFEIADMKKEVMRGNNSPFSSVLKEELQNCLDAHNQAIIFLNQRGYSKTVICAECGHVQKCPNCDVSLTYHKEDDSLLCHYCGAKFKMVSACTECGSPFLRYGGFGTERVVIELKKLFPSARILRMDRDTTQNKEGHIKILNQFSERNADILVGTQMIAKGHDFPFVTLVGILDADMSLHFSDYRSSERTFQLLTQVAGRSGRSDAVGKVVLQTYSPEHPVLRQAINYDYDGFFEHEVSIRKATWFPPFTNILRVLIEGANENSVINATKSMYEEIKLIYENRKEDFRFFGCMKAPLKKLQGKYRYQILMRVLKEDLPKQIFYTVDKYNNYGLNVYLEVNPNNLT